ncbi:DHA2 family efflux MFS transporter permease subunit [Actinomadura alba]|uniref:DHA2 family efflux MFS transporter permease subunit n=1 Tax=Actinomadura alba TaxID=406431 RepID=A0ABR7LRC0_9ACTN|nr:DHA2 family efflux MFS transporter permease subunit [Actinomadura alba]MBC6467392.1 DHA2 family efflux MFS transporter permease subunit [Actinomadura alba]
MALNDQETDAPQRQRWTVVIVSIVSFMVGLDVLVLMTALPTIREELGADAAGIGWTINAYEIGFAALILTGAALGDRYGRRLLFVIGVAAFTVGSAWCALSSSIEMLVVARAFQGLGGGVAVGLSLALISSVTPPAKRGAAFGVWGAVTGTAVAVGPIVGGAIVHGLTWQWIFWLNVPVGVILLGLSLVKITESTGNRLPIDVVGLILSSIGLVTLAQALLRGSDAGWTAPSILLGLIGGVVALALFVLWEHRNPAPMMPLAIFRNLSFTGGCGASFIMGVALYGQTFIFAQYLQVALEQDALGVGIRLLPWVSTAPLVAPLAGQLADRIGERPLVITGFVLFAAAFFLMAPLARSDASYATLVIPLIIAGIGGPITFVSMSSAVMRAVEPARLGIASGVSIAVRQVGAVFGVAVAVAVFTSSGGGFAAPQQFVDGYGPAATVLAVIALLGVVPALVIRPLTARDAPTRAAKADSV